MDDFQLQIATYKIQYGEVFQCEVEDDSFIFRLLTRKEYQDTLKITNDPAVIEEMVCQMAVLYPKGINFSQYSAGTVESLAANIVNESGFGGAHKSHDYFAHYRMGMGTFDMQAEATIQAAFPTITEEVMQDWTVSKLMKMLAKAEWVLKNIKGYPISFELGNENNEEGEEEEPQEPPTWKELGDELRQQGHDPMFAYADLLIKPTNKIAEFPFIAGTNYWKQVFTRE